MSRDDLLISVLHQVIAQSPLDQLDNLGAIDRLADQLEVQSITSSQLERGSVKSSMKTMKRD